MREFANLVLNESEKDLPQETYFCCHAYFSNLNPTFCVRAVS